MASFVDQPYQFNEFVQTTPIESMVKVGMHKQERYDQNVQRIQATMDAQAALPVMRDVDKSYLQSMLNSVHGELKKVGAADFSQQQLMDSVGGMADQISKDQNILSAVQSTENHRIQQQRMEDARQKGVLTPQNETAYNEQIGNYLNSDKLGETFNGRYVDYYDVDKDMQDAIGKAHADGVEWEEASNDPAVLFQRFKKGLLSGKVANIVGTVFSKPQVQQQLAINAMYDFKGYTPDNLIETQDKSIQYYREKAKKDIEQLSLANQISQQDGGKANKQILDISARLAEKEQEYSSFVKLAKTNPDAAKVQLYQQNLAERYISDYSWEESGSKSVVSPHFTASMQRANYQLALDKEQFDQFQANRMFGLAEKAEARMQSEGMIKAQIAAGKLNPDGSPKVFYNFGAISPDEVAKLGSASYLEETKDLNTKRVQLQAELVSTLPGFEDLYVKKDGVWTTNVGKYPDWKSSDSKYRQSIQALDQAHLNGTLKPNYRSQVKEYYDLNSLVLQNTQKIEEIEKKYSPEISSIINKIPAINTSVLINGKNVPVNKDDLVRFWTYKNSTDVDVRNSAKQFLTNKYGENFSNSSFSELLEGRTPTRAEGTKMGYAPGTDEKSKSQVGKLRDVYLNLNNLISNKPEVALALSEREQDFKKLQEQQQTVYGTFNTAKAEDKQSTNAIYAGILSNVIGEKSSGEYKKLATWLNPTDAKDLNSNIYDYYKGKDNKWYLQVRRNTGEGFEFSEAVPVDERVIKQVIPQENVNEQEFKQTFGGFLNNHEWKSTTNNLTSPQAENTAISRRTVGKYSVGYHLKSFNGGWVPYLYIRDKDGNVLANGLELDFSAYSKEKSFSPQQREAFKNSQTILPTQDVIKTLDAIDENLINLMLKDN